MDYAKNNATHTALRNTVVAAAAPAPAPAPVADDAADEHRQRRQRRE
jgi:hypothetical protein